MVKKSEEAREGQAGIEGALKPDPLLLDFFLLNGGAAMSISPTAS